MQIIADLHIHSKYSRACSQQLTLENIDKYSRMKGVDVVATGDFTHPLWFKELREKLIEREPGLYVLKSETNARPTRFLCSVEISCIYFKSGKTRRLHIVIFAPNLETVEKINVALGKIGNLSADGRPILGLDAKELAKIVLGINEKCMIVPAHIWTPWFAMFGSKSGFDSIEECFEEYSNKIFAIETGLSSDPLMNWRVKNLDKVSIISNSDAHSLPNIAREANVFELDENQLSYDGICQVIKRGDKNNFLYTIEFYPEEGMYHFDGHRECGVSFSPSQSKKLKNICPVCKKPLTIGVLHRVEELAEANRPEGYIDTNRVPFKKLIELDKIIAESLNIKSRRAKQVQNEYMNLVNSFGSEFEVLLNASEQDLEKITLPQIVEGIKRMRQGRVIVRPGFDGQYGEIKIFDQDEKINYQKTLFN